MDALLKDFNQLNENSCKPFAKFKNHPLGTEFKVLSFKKYTTKFGTTIVVETTNHLFNLPNRFTKLFDTDEKINQWNAQNNLVVTYNGTQNGMTLVTINKK